MQRFKIFSDFFSCIPLICPKTHTDQVRVRRVFDDAEAAGVTPLDAAEQLAEARLRTPVHAMA